MQYDVFCEICGYRFPMTSTDVRVSDHLFYCADETACLERKAASPGILDARDNPVPVIAAREDLEALLNRELARTGRYELVDLIMRAADRYATAATADHAGLDAILGPSRLAAADAELHRPKGRNR